MGLTHGLPWGWRVATDASTGKTYYYSNAGAVTFEKPLKPSGSPSQIPSQIPTALAALLLLLSASAAFRWPDSWAHWASLTAVSDPPPAPQCSAVEHEVMQQMYAAAAEKESVAAEAWFAHHSGAPRGIAAPLEPSGAWFGSDEVLSALNQGRLVRVSEPFPRATASELYDELAGLPPHVWTWHRGAVSGFQFQHHHLFTSPNLLENHCPTFVRACAWFEDHFAAWIRHATGLRGSARASASWFAPGDFSSPHNDQDDGNVIAFVWHVTRGWDERDGGDLVWLDPYLRFPPSENTLYLFVVRDESDHLVQAVWDHAGTGGCSAGSAAKRLAINGWFKVEPGQEVPWAARSPSTRHIPSNRFVFHTNPVSDYLDL